MANERRPRPRPSGPSCCGCHLAGPGELPRRAFLETAGGAALLAGLSWSALAAGEGEAEAAPPRKPLVVKPIFTYTTYSRRHQRSWRSWGGIETQEDVAKEVVRIRGELEKLEAAADFPVKFLPLAAVRRASEVASLKDAATADAVLAYAANGNALSAIESLGKPVVVFLRHRSGPLYLWYEIISPRYLRRHTDKLAIKGFDEQDVVVDSLDEVVWRLRALCGLKNTLGSRIVAIGGPSGWGPSGRRAPELAASRWKLDIHSVPYPELGKLIQAAMADKAAVALARKRAAAYLAPKSVSLECKKPAVENAFLLDQVFRAIMAKVGARAITVNHCMGTIMPIAQTTACLTLSLLNDDGYLAFCESDFVVIPAGILLSQITGRPPFLNDPTYPHDGVITLAHCTAPRKMDGKTLEPARIVTHFESDYGAAPKVEMRKGQKITNVLPDFAAQRWIGLGAEIVDAPFLPICRSQIDVQFKADSLELAQRMPGFHWMTVYGDCLREAAYALKKTPIAFDILG